MSKGAVVDNCGVEIRAKNGALECVTITLRGDIAFFPSTSNSREIRYKWGFSRKTGTRCRLPFLSKSKFQTDRLKLITAYYTAALLSMNAPPPSFDDEKVTVLVTLAAQPGRSDSHNFSKPIGDWLQNIGVIKDDTNAEIFCRKSTEYDTANSGITSIVIVRRTAVQAATQALFEAAWEDDGETN